MSGLDCGFGGVVERLRMVISRGYEFCSENSIGSDKERFDGGLCAAGSVGDLLVAESVELVEDYGLELALVELHESPPDMFNRG